MQSYENVDLIYCWMPRLFVHCLCMYMKSTLSVFGKMHMCFAVQHLWQSHAWFAMACFFWHVYRGEALNVQVHALQMGMYHASMTRACRQRQRLALTACCAITQVLGSLWQRPDYAPTRRLWLAGQSTVSNPCPPRMRCCCQYRTWMTICVVEHVCLVHVFDVEGMSLMCMRAYY